MALLQLTPAQRAYFERAYHAIMEARSNLDLAQAAGAPYLHESYSLVEQLRIVLWNTVKAD